MTRHARQVDNNDMSIMLRGLGTLLVAGIVIQTMGLRMGWTADVRGEETAVLTQAPSVPPSDHSRSSHESHCEPRSPRTRGSLC